MRAEGGSCETLRKNTTQMNYSSVKYIYVTLLTIGIATVAIALAAASFNMGFTPGVGPMKMAMLLAGLGTVCASFALRAEGIKTWVIGRTRISQVVSISASLVQKSPIGCYWCVTITAITLLLASYALYTWYMVFGLYLSSICIVIAGCIGNSVFRASELRQRIVFSHIVALLLLFTFGIGLEVISAFMVPAWPMRELRPVRVTKAWAKAVGGGFNSWGLRDAERGFQKPPGIKRIVFLGDSMLEAAFSRNAHPGYVCDELAQRGINSIECFNLGISTTGPRHYLYRMRHIGMNLSPDAVLLYIYPGNDLVGLSYNNQPITLIDERPLPSIIGRFMPRLTWLLVNRLGISEFGRSNKPISNESEDLQQISEMPYEKGITELSDHMHRHYFPKVAPKRIEDILRRGGPLLWQEIAPRWLDREYLFGWRIKQVVYDALHKRPAVTSAMPNSKLINATASYIDEIARDLEERHIPLVVFLVPVAENVDPAYRKFWEPWYLGDNDPYNRIHREALFKVLRSHGVKVVDLAEILNGIPGTYRKLDGHWTERGHAIVSGHVAGTVLGSLRSSSAGR